MQHQPTTSSGEWATFGAIHLNNTSLEKATRFWTQIVGMTLRHTTAKTAEFGSTYKTLVVVHQAATSPYRPGYSGLYHAAIHPPNKAEFARMLYRLLAQKYPCSPTDHTMSQSVYLHDPDGITIEFTLETPERFRRVVTTGGLSVETAEGIIRPASVALDIDEVLAHLPEHTSGKNLADGTSIGHLHLYAQDVVQSAIFYEKMGFQQFNYLPQFLYADLSAGGAYQHRIAMNAWHGLNKPLAPAANAGLRHFQIVYDSKERLGAILAQVEQYQEKSGEYWVQDPTGNSILLSHN